MKEVIEEIRRWRDSHQQIALATVVQTWGSAPRRPGAKMAITANGQMSGSVSGGCVEGAVVEEAFAVLESHKPKLLHYGVADEMGWEVGLACGGNIQVFVEQIEDAFFERVNRLIQEERAGAVVTVIAGPDNLLGRKLFVESDQAESSGSIDATLDATITQLARSAIQRGRDEQVTLAEAGIELFIDVLLPPPTLIMVGGVHIAITLATLAKTQGYRTIVIDPRQAFGSDERFPHVDHLLRAWPEEAFAQLKGQFKVGENSAIAILTHDPKIDDPALQSVLRSPAFYIGALGSRKTHAKRLDRLREEGFTEQELDRIHAPIGLEIDAQTPEQIALAVMAQIVNERNSVRAPAGRV